MAGEYNRAAGMDPYSLKDTLVNPLARMLPFRGTTSDVYRMGEACPPGLRGYGPTWEVISLALAGRGTLQVRVNVQRDFYLMALSATSSAAGGFRAQLYDANKKRRLADRGINFPNLFGSTGRPLFLREPYNFDQPDAQILCVVQNLDAGANTIQIVLYGVALRFNEAGPQFPGGNVASGGQ